MQQSCAASGLVERLLSMAMGYMVRHAGSQLRSPRSESPPGVVGDDPPMMLMPGADIDARQRRQTAALVGSEAKAVSQPG